MPAKYHARLVGMAGVWLASTVASPSVAAATADCFDRLDSGVDLAGWSVSTTNGHGPGEGFTVEDGAIVGRQTAGQSGGILMSDKSFSDVEVTFEVQIDWGCDSGFFLRTTAGDRAYQVLLDHLPKGSVGTLYGENFATSLFIAPYTLTDEGHSATAARGQTPIFDLELWPTIWRPAEFNRLRVLMTGNPPHIRVWVTDTEVLDFTDDMLRDEIEPAGPLALQVHSGDRWVDGGAVRFRNIWARDLTVDCEPAAGGAGGAGGADADASAGGDDAGAGGDAGDAGANAGGDDASGGAGMDSRGGGGQQGGVAVAAPSGSLRARGGCALSGPPESGSQLQWLLLLLASLCIRRSLNPLGVATSRSKAALH
jgi:hypothetical protein